MGAHRIFICYSHKDERWKDWLKKHVGRCEIVSKYRWLIISIRGLFLR
jgi:hypothetical protein